MTVAGIATTVAWQMLGLKMLVFEGLPGILASLAIYGLTTLPGRRRHSPG